MSALFGADFLFIRFFLQIFNLTTKAHYYTYRVPKIQFLLDFAYKTLKTA